jgi:hypothetical protein
MQTLTGRANISVAGSVISKLILAELTRVWAMMMRGDGYKSKQVLGQPA